MKNNKQTKGISDTELTESRAYLKKMGCKRTRYIRTFLQCIAKISHRVTISR